MTPSSPRGPPDDPLIGLIPFEVVLVRPAKITSPIVLTFVQILHQALVDSPWRDRDVVRASQPLNPAPKGT